MSVQIHDGKIQIDGLDDIVDGAIRDAQEAIRSSGLPDDVRDKLQKRLDKVKDTVKTRLSHLDASNIDQLGEELSKMGDDIGKQMEEFGKEMEKYGKKAGKNFGKGGWKGHGGHFQWDSKDKDKDKDKDDDEDNDDADVPSVPDVDDADDLDDAVKSLGDLSLKAPQREQIQKLRADSERQVAAAKRQLDQASDTLTRQLENSATSDADIARSIDAVTQQEAAIRKARILAWHSARRVLDDAQRRKVEDAASKARKGH
jgi:DNA anti-recombination protein RmuC